MKLIERTKELIDESVQVVVNPIKFWKYVDQNKDLFAASFNKLLAPSLLLLILSVIVGDVLFESEFGILWSDVFVKAARKVLLVILTFLASNMIIYESSRIFKIPVEYETARKLSIYSMVPFVAVITLVSLFPFLDVISLASVYGFYILYNGLIVIYGIRPQKSMGYLFTIFILILIAYFIIYLLLNKLTALIVY